MIEEKVFKIQSDEDLLSAAKMGLKVSRKESDRIWLTPRDSGEVYVMREWLQKRRAMLAVVDKPIVVAMKETKLYFV